MRPLHERLTYGFVIGTSLMHVFCCGIPLLLAFTNVAALFGIASAGTFHSGWFEQFEVTALVVAGAMLLITGVIQYASNRIDCHTDGACSHQPCDSKKRFSQRVFKFAVLLYIINIIVYVVSHQHLFHAHTH